MNCRKVSIPLHVYTCRDRVDKLNISIPLHIYTSLPATDAGILYSRLDKLKVLPEGWVTSSIQVAGFYLHCITNLRVFLLVILVLTKLNYLPTQSSATIATYVALDTAIFIKPHLSNMHNA